jgi:hypothetical protein
VSDQRERSSSDCGVSRESRALSLSASSSRR